MGEDDGVASTTRVVGGVTLISRLFGLVRDLVLVRVFGDTAIGSAFNAAFTLPNLFRRLFGEGALSAALIPVYAKAGATGERSSIASVVLVVVAGVTGLITIVGELLLWLWLSGGSHSGANALSIELLMYAAPFMPLVCLSAAIGGMLQVHGRFLPAAAAPIVLNAFLIVTGVWRLLGRAGEGDPGRDGVWLVIAVVAAGAAQLVWSVVELSGRVGFRSPRASWGEARGAVREISRLFLPAMIGLGTLQLSTVIDVTIAMWPIWVGPEMFGRSVPLDEASNAILSFTQRLYQFPLGVFGIAVATAAFPAMSKQTGDDRAFGRVLGDGVRLSLFLALPAAVGLAIVAPDLAATLFSGGESGFSEDGVVRSAAALRWYALGLAAYSVNHLVTRAFYARQDTTTPMRVSIASLGVNALLNLVLIWWLREAGLAAGTAISACVQAVALTALLGRRLDLGRLGLLASVLGLVWRAALMGVIVFGAVAFLPAETWGQRAVRLGVGVGVGGVAYLVLSLGRPELRRLVGGRPVGGRRGSG